MFALKKMFEYEIRKEKNQPVEQQNAIPSLQEFWFKRSNEKPTVVMFVVVGGQNLLELPPRSASAS